jgi:hypothetical protein
VWGKERETKGEVGAREDGESLDENVGDGLIAGKMGVELVAGASLLATSDDESAVQNGGEKAVR